MDACELSEFITPCEWTPGTPESPSVRRMSGWGSIAPLRIDFNRVR